MKNIIKKHMSVLMVLILILYLVPTPTTALSFPTNDLTNNTETVQTDVIPNNFYTATTGRITSGVTEITSLRSENVKHFQMPDGTMQAIVFANSIHEKDSNGIWQPIDSSLHLQNNSGIMMYTTNDEKTSFASSLTSNSPIFKLSENGYIITMSLDNTLNINSIHAADKTISATVASNEPAQENEWQSLDDAISSITSESTILYTSVYPHTDIEYKISNNVVKENIILKSADSATEFKFEYQLVGLSAALNDDGSISFIDDETNELKYEIPSPFMYDANGKISRDVYYTLSEEADGVYSVTVTADDIWLSDETCAYPVVIDPSISSNRVTYDTFANSADPDGQYGDWAVWIGPSYTGFIRSNMPTLPSGAIITQGELNAYYYYQPGVTGSRNIGAYKMNQSWDEMSDTYNSLKNRYGNSLGASTTVLSTATATASTNITLSNPELISFDVTDAVLSWYSGGNNYGIALKHYNGYLLPTSGINTGTIILNYEAHTDYTAYFTISYMIPNGVYAIEKANTCVYVRNITLDELAWVFQDPFDIPPTSESTREYMFKFTYRAETDDYVIRSMSNNEIIIYPSVYNNAPVAGKVTVSGSPATDSNISTAFTWKMSATSDGYDYIWYEENGTIYYMRSTSNEGGGPILSFTTNPNDSGTKWDFHKYTGSAIDGVTNIAYSDVLLTGETFDYDVCMYSSTIGRNGPIVYNVSEPDYSPTNKATINSSTGVLTTLKGGIVRVQWTYSGSPWIWSRLVTITKVVNVKCFNNEGYWDVPNGNSSQQVECNESNQLERAVWVFEERDNGYYTIRNYSSGRYLQNSENDLHHIEYPSTTFDNSVLWKPIRQLDGTYKIQSKLNSAYYISEQDASHSLQDPNITLSNTAEELRQKWHITPKKFTAQVNNYYDLGYSVYYSETSSTSAVNINTYLENVGNVYCDLLGLDLTYTASYYNSPIDICKGTVTSSNIHTLCTHLGTKHTDRSEVIDAFSSTYSGSNTITNIYWSGHKIKSIATNGTINYNRSCSAGTSIIMIERSNSTNRTIDSESVLMHELNHQYGARDHYHELADLQNPNSCKFKDICSECGDHPRPRSCIMYQGRMDIDSPDVICDGCYTDMGNHLDNHHGN